MSSSPQTVEEYLASLPEDRRDAISKIRESILANLDEGFQETMQYGMIGYSVPHSVYPAGYHCDPKQPVPFAAIGNQKNHIGIYLFSVYVNEQESRRFQEAWKKTGKKLDMGKSCVRVRKLNDIPLEVLGETIKRAKLKDFIAHYESVVKPRDTAQARSQ